MKRSQNVVVRDKEVLGGTPVFAGTRVPVHSLIDHLKAGESVESFLEDFPSVRREQVTAFLELAETAVLEELGVASSSR
jgi:uncharacterized protein (DUF433 family)